MQSNGNNNNGGSGIITGVYTRGGGNKKLRNVGGSSLSPSLSPSNPNQPSASSSSSSSSINQWTSPYPVSAMAQASSAGLPRTLLSPILVGPPPPAAAMVAPPVASSSANPIFGGASFNQWLSPTPAVGAVQASSSNPLGASFPPTPSQSQSQWSPGPNQTPSHHSTLTVAQSQPLSSIPNNNAFPNHSHGHPHNFIPNLNTNAFPSQFNLAPPPLPNSNLGASPPPPSGNWVSSAPALALPTPQLPPPPNPQNLTFPNSFIPSPPLNTQPSIPHTQSPNPPPTPVSIRQRMSKEYGEGWMSRSDSIKSDLVHRRSVPMKKLPPPTWRSTTLNHISKQELGVEMENDSMYKKPKPKALKRELLRIKWNSYVVGSSSFNDSASASTSASTSSTPPPLNPPLSLPPTQSPIPTPTPTLTPVPAPTIPTLASPSNPPPTPTPDPTPDPDPIPTPNPSPSNPNPVPTMTPTSTLAPPPDLDGEKEKQKKLKDLEREKEELMRREQEWKEKRRREAEEKAREEHLKESNQRERERMEELEKERKVAALKEKRRIKALEKEKEREKEEKLQREVEERERIKVQKEEEERMQRESKERERLSKERAEREKIETERVERIRIEKEKEKNMKIEMEMAERMRLEKERVEKERSEMERRAERERIRQKERERENARIQMELWEEERRIEKESALKIVIDIERACKERKEKEREEKERVAMEKEREREEKEKLEMEREEEKKREMERIERTKMHEAMEMQKRKDEERRLEFNIAHKAKASSLLRSLVIRKLNTELEKKKMEVDSNIKMEKTARGETNADEKENNGTSTESNLLTTEPTPERMQSENPVLNPEPNLLPRLNNCEYYTVPSLLELAKAEVERPGYCSRVPDFVVGRRGYGEVWFVGETDVRGLDLDDVVLIQHCQVRLYTGDTPTPPAGQGLNKPARVTYLNILPTKDWESMKNGWFRTNAMILTLPLLFSPSASPAFTISPTSCAPAGFTVGKALERMEQMPQPIHRAFDIDTNLLQFWVPWFVEPQRILDEKKESSEEKDSIYDLHRLKNPTHLNPTNNHHHLQKIDVHPNPELHPSNGSMPLNHKTNMLQMNANVTCLKNTRGQESELRMNQKGEEVLVREKKRKEENCLITLRITLESGGGKETFEDCRCCFENDDLEDLEEGNSFEDCVSAFENEMDVELEEEEKNLFQDALDCWE